MEEETKLQGQEPEEPDFGQGTLARVGMFFIELIKVAVLAGITIALVRYFLFKPFYVKGASMEPNFIEKDYLIIDELTYRFREPERGETVVFDAPIGDGSYYLKRVIGLPGEQIKVEDNKVVVFNEKYPQGYVLEEDYIQDLGKTSGFVSVTLGPNQYFVLGDNRLASFDSRRFGPVPGNDIVGKAWVRGWPFSRAATFEKPDYNF